MNANDLNLLSVKRSSLMGFATLLVVFHHCPVNIPLPLHIGDWIHQNGGFGVDIFLLLSGMGLTFSANKRKSWKLYYTRRFIRIFPVYCFVICLISTTKIIWGAIGFDLLGLFFKLTTLGHWLGESSFEWFIPNLVLLYAVFPFLYETYKRINDTKLIMGGIIIAYGILCMLPYGSYFQQYLRWPVFALGVFIGWYMNYSGTALKTMAYRGVLVLALAGFVLTYVMHLKYRQPGLDPIIVPEIKQNGWLYYPYFFIVLGGLSCTSLFIFLKAITAYR